MTRGFGAPSIRPLIIAVSSPADQEPRAPNFAHRLATLF